jgi:hypothetical protein
MVVMVVVEEEEMEVPAHTQEVLAHKELTGVLQQVIMLQI